MSGSAIYGAIARRGGPIVDERPTKKEWLDTLENEYRAGLPRLRYVESMLLKHGRVSTRKIAPARLR